MIRCLIIDDEELARRLLESYINRLGFLELVGSFECPLQTIPFMKKNAIDLIFLDIQMSEIKGTDFVKLISPNIKVIFTTAYSEYALEGYDLNALDYLLKPIVFERFLKAVNKLNPTNPILNEEETITIKSGYDLFKLKLNDILYIESDSEYVVFYTVDKKIMSLLSLKSLEKTLDQSMFMRVHRSFIVNKTKVTGLKGKDLLISDIKIAVSNSYYDNVKKELF